jgi:hypothetical protein
VLGTRDVSDIYLSDGRTLTAAIGDAGAATETALKAVLQAATFADEGQKKLVDDMLAQGKGFDAVLSALQADATTKAQNAAAAATKKRELEIALMTATGDSAGALAATRADELAAIKALDPALVDLQQSLYNAQDAAQALTNAKASTDAAFAQGQAADQAHATAVAGALATLKTAYDASVASISGLQTKFQGFVDSLLGYVDTLKARAAGVSGSQATYDSAKAAFNAVAGRTDDAAFGALQTVGNAFLDASKVNSKDALAYLRDIATVKKATLGMEGFAKTQVDYQASQLAALNKAVVGIDGVIAATVSVKDALSKYFEVLHGGAVNDNKLVTDHSGSLPTGPGDAALKYLENNPDVNALAQNALSAGKFQNILDASVFYSHNGGASAGDPSNDALNSFFHSSLFDGLPDHALDFYKNLPGFATGGSFQVGGTGGIDSQVSSLRLSPGEYVGVSHTDPSAANAAILAALSAQNDLLSKSVSSTEAQTALLRKLSLGGTSLQVTMAA